MSPYSPSQRRLRATDVLPPWTPGVLPWRQARYERMRVDFADGARTTLHVASYDLRAFRPRVVALERPAPLVRWCDEHDVRHAIVGGFFVRPGYAPLGQLQIEGGSRPSVAFDPPWGEIRACLHLAGETIRIARRNELDPEPAGDLLQAGPLLVAGGRRMIVEDEDTEGFAAAAHQFDSDITSGRHPRSALATTGERLLAVACDGRNRRDAGMTMLELADALIELGADDALNLDGGGSASLVHAGRLRNRPREENGVDLLDGRRVVTAVVFESR